MAVQHMNPTIEQQARLLANDNRRAEPQIARIFWFPNDKEVRLVELIDQVPSSADRQVQPFYFRPSPQDNLPAPSAIAMIRPDEYGALRLPEGWGDWDDATEL